MTVCCLCIYRKFILREITDDNRVVHTIASLSSCGSDFLILLISKSMQDYQYLVPESSIVYQCIIALSEIVILRGFTIGE